MTTKNLIKKIGIFNILSIILSKNKKDAYKKMTKLLILNMIQYYLKNKRTSIK